MADYFAAVDVGAGSGAKFGLFDAELNLMREYFLPRNLYGNTPTLFVDALEESVRALRSDSIRALGLAAPGITDKDGSYIITANLPFPSGFNPRAELSTRLELPVAHLNDGDAGGLGVYAECGRDVLYWAFGGGFGGSWVSREGSIMHSSVGWDRVATLHPADEPGYAVLLSPDELDGALLSFHSSYDRLQRVLNEAGVQPVQGSFRAEEFVSGKGIPRLYKALGGHNTSWTAVSLKEAASGGDTPSLDTFHLFGRLLGLVGEKVISRVERDGGSRDIPLYVGGGVARALPLFAGETEEMLSSYGILKRLQRPHSPNPNLVGAALAARALAE